MKLHHKPQAVALFLAVFCILTACSHTGGQDTSVTTLVYANLTEGGVNRQIVDQFNRTHTDVQIEVRDYFGEGQSSGKDLLFAEIGAGKVPDIIDLGSDISDSCRLPYRMMVQRGLLENLWPYIENDPELGRDGVVEAPLKAAEVNGGLYAAFSRVSVNTLVGAESTVGDRYSWTLAELQDAFAGMPENSTIMDFFFTKQDLFQYLFRMSIEKYVDWETGQCSFTSEEFRSALEFISTFPDSLDAGYQNDYEAMNMEATDRLMHGYQMLAMADVTRPSEIQVLDAYYGQGGHAALIGYPIEDGGSGSSFYIGGQRLAMSSTCKDKEAAWDFLRQLFLPRYKSIDLMKKEAVVWLPVNRADYDLLKELDVRLGREGYVSHSAGPVIKFRRTTAEELQRFEDFIQHIDKIDLYDKTIFDIAWELAGSYFAGDKTLDETVDLIQNRVTLYVNENR